MPDTLDTAGAVASYMNNEPTPAPLGAQARYSMANVVGVNSTYEAELRGVAQRTGVPVDTVRSYPDEMKKQAAMGAYDFDKLAVEFPNTTKFLADQDKAAVGYEDTGVLKSMESAAKWFVSAPGTERNLANGAEYLARSAHSGLLSLTGSIGKLASNAVVSESDLAALYKNDPLGLQNILDNSAAAAPIRFARSQQQGSEAAMEALSPGAKAQYGDLKYATLEEDKSAWRSPLKIVGDALQSLPSSLAMGVSMYLTKGAGQTATAQALAAGLTPAAARAAGVLAAGQTMSRVGAVSEGVAGYTQQANQAREDADKVKDEALAQSEPYKKLLADGYDPKVARILVSANAAEQAGVIAGIVDAAVNFVGGKFLGHAIGEGGKFAGAKAGVTEALTEAVQSPGEQFGQNVAMQKNLDPNQDLSEGVLESMLQGLAVGGLSGGAMGHLAGRTTKDEHAAGVAEQHAQVLTDMQTTMQASKMLEHSPDTLRSYAQDLADQGVPMVYVDSAKLVEAGVDLQALAQIMPSVAAQLGQVQTGGDLAIPTGELLTNSIGTVFAQPLIDHARTDVNGMSREEAKVYMQEKGDALNAEIEQVMAAKENDAEFKAGRDQVQAQILTQLNDLKRFTAKVNEQYATLASNFYAVMAARTGMTVPAFTDKYGLGFSASETAGGMYDQAPAAELGKNFLERVKTDPTMVDEYIAQNGKLVDPDMAKRLSPEYAADPSLARFVHEGSSELAQRVYERLLSENPKGQAVMFTAGGGGSGKSEAMPLAKAAAGIAGDGITVDGTLSNFAKSTKRIDQALASGAPVQIVYTNRGANDAFNFAMRRERVVPISVLAKAHAGASDTIRKLAEHYANDPRVQIQIVNNLGSKDDVHLGKLDDVPTYDHNGLERGFHDFAENAFQIGNIDQDKYRALTGLANEHREAGVQGIAGSTPSSNQRIQEGPSDPGADSSGERGPGPLLGETFRQGVGKSNNGPVTLGSLALKGNDQAVVAQALMHRAGLSAEQLGNIFEGVAASPESDGFGSVPPLKTVLAQMRAAVLDDPKILNAVVGSVPVDVVNNLFGSQDAAKVALHDEAMLQDSPAFNADLSVSASLGGTASSVGLLVRKAARQAAEIARISLGTGMESSEGSTTPGTSQGYRFNQGKNSRAQITFGNDITLTQSVISLLSNADLSSFIHESGHFFLEVQTDLANRIAARAAQGEVIGAGEQSILDDMGKTLDWMGVKATPEMSALDHWAYLSTEEKRPYHEQWARGFEAYAFEGKAPSLDLQHTFQTFRAWLVNVYRALLKSVNASKTDVAGALKVELSDEVRSVMDRMLATSDQIAETEAARSMGPLFKTAEQAGMTVEEFTAYHDQGTQATMDAVDELQSKGLRDMQWLQNARSRKLKELQKQHDALRAQVTREVRAEVLSRPIYRAWTFLTSKQSGKVVGEKPAGNAKGLNPEVDNLFTAIAKLGGLDRAEVKKLWGIDEKEKMESGVFGMPVVRKTGGLSTDAMAERLVENGYLLPDKNGKADFDKFKELFDGQRRGMDHYSINRDMAAAYGDAPLNLPEMPEVGFGRLRTEELRRRYGTADDAVWRKLSALRMTSDEGGLHPDVVGELFGFGSGDELVKTLAAAEPPKSVIEGMTDTRMLQEHGDLATPAGLERAADAAIHNDARARFVATELKALQKAMSVREKVPGQRNTVDVLARAARDYATATIAKLRVRDIRPGQYAAAEVRSAKAAAKAVGDIAQATLHKRNQLINLYATKAAYAAQDEVKSAVEYFKKFDTVSKTLDPEYADQIHALLERFDLRASTSLKAIDKRKSLVEWAQSQVDQGLEPDIPPELLQEANRKSFKDMTVEEVRGLRDTIKQIEHLGRLKNKLLTAQANRDFAAAVDEISASINLEAGDRQADTRTPNTVLGAKLVGLKNFWAEHIKTATWARIMDGGKDGGPVWEYLIRTANTAGDNEVVMREKATKELAKLVAPVLKEGKMGGKGDFFPSINRSLNKEARLAIVLNMGNEGNIQRLLGGEGWTIQQLQPVLASLSAEDVKFVQAVWDHFESYRPAIGAKEKRVYGKEPNWVEPTPLNTPHGELRGGYYPVKYDPRASERAESHEDAEAAKRQLAGAYTSATTRRSFTKSRVEEVHGRPLLYSMDGIYNGVQEVIHDLTWHEWLIDANKLVRNRKIAEAMRSKYGPDAHQQFKKWLEDNAAGDRGAQGAGEKTLAYIRQGVSVSGLGLNVMSALMQPLGITQSMVRIGPKWVGKGVAKFIGSPLDTADAINEKSDFMRTRALTRLREINEVRSQVKGRTKIREGIDASAYFLMMRCQQAVDIPTWWGAYEKAIAEGNDESRAVALSDQAVIDAQGSGGTKDQSAIERGGPGIKLFTTFYSFFNTALNLGVQKTMNHESKAKLAADYLLLYSIPVILGAALKDALTPGDSGDWDDPEHIIKKLIGEHLSFLFGLMVGVREVTGAVQAATGTAQFGTDYSGPAGVRMLADFVKLGKQLNQGELDTGLRKAIVNTSGELLRLPAAQINRTVNGIQALNEGKTQNPGALLTGYQEPH